MTLKAKLSVITDEIGQDIEEILPTLKPYGIDSVELRHVWGKYIVYFTDDELEQLKKVLDENDISVSNIAGPMFKCYAPWTSKHDESSKSFGHNVQVSRDNAGRVLEICKMLGAAKTRVFGFLYPFNPVTFMLNFKYPPVSEEQWQLLVNEITAFVDLAKAEKITVVMENEAMALVSTWASTLRILEDIIDPYFKLLLDPGNFFFCNEILPPQTYDEIVDRVGHHHVKDGKKTLGFKHFTIVGEGLLDYPAYFDYWVEKTGPSSCFSLETHVLMGKKNVSYKSLENMKRMLDG